MTGLVEVDRKILYRFAISAIVSVINYFPLEAEEYICIQYTRISSIIKKLINKKKRKGRWQLRDSAVLVITSNPRGHSIRQLWAGQARGLSQLTASLLGVLVPGTSTPISSTHQQPRPCGSHCILSNSPVTLSHFGTNCDGPLVVPGGRERLTAANASCSHPVSSPVTQRRPHAVLQQRSPGEPWH